MSLSPHMKMHLGGRGGVDLCVYAVASTHALMFPFRVKKKGAYTYLPQHISICNNASLKHFITGKFSAILNQIIPDMHA